MINSYIVRQIPQEVMTTVILKTATASETVVGLNKTSHTDEVNGVVRLVERHFGGRVQLVPVDSILAISFPEQI